jgi:hypothetical protein
MTRGKEQSGIESTEESKAQKTHVGEGGNQWAVCVEGEGQRIGNEEERMKMNNRTKVRGGGKSERGKASLNQVKRRET